MDDTRLAVSATLPSGDTRRWGPDEHDGQNIPGGLTFTTKIPGGFDTLETTLLRRLDTDYPDQNILGDLRVYGPGNETVWEGRAQQFPRQESTGFGISVRGVGHAADLANDPSFRQVYVDRDPASWGDPALDRQIVLSTSSKSTTEIDATADGGGLLWSLPPTLSNDSLRELWWFGPAGVLVNQIQYVGADAGTFTGLEAATIFTASDSTAASTDSAVLTMDGALHGQTVATAYRHMMMRVHNNSGASKTPGNGAQRRFTKIAVYGDHGLTLRPTDAASPQGLYASDMIADVVATAAPALARNITATSYAIPHAAFKDPVTAEDAISSLNAYHLHKWGVYDDRTFFYAPWDDTTDTVWEARRSRGARITFEGDNGDGLYNGVLVFFTDAESGQQLVAGPTGCTTADVTDASLADTSEENPVNANSLGRKWAKLQLSFVTTPAGAIALGATWLAEHTLPTRAGQITVQGHVAHPTRGSRPAWAVRAGDWIRISDHPADVARRITQTQYRDDTRELVCTVDNTPTLLDQILARVGVSLVGVI